ncbi:MAG: site-specific tyrosine recombinase XerD [Clostridia bacterium]|nr:site-specific tyrosine recombinase XerD [Clostridia bacterium]
MNEIMLAYQTHLMKEKQLAENSVASYVRDIRKFQHYIGDVHKKETFLDVNKTHVMSYVMHLQESGMARTTILRNVASIRSLFNFCEKKRMIDNNPTDSIHTPPVEKKTPVILSFEEVEQLLNQPDGKTANGARDIAMLELLYATGIRVSELMALNLDDIDLKLGSLKCSSGSKVRVIPIGKMAKDALNKYVETYREQFIKGENDALFLNYYGERLSRQGFWKIVKTHCKNAGLTRSVTPHTLRHSFASHLIQNGADIKSVQELLGHSDISTTQMYVAINKKKVNEDYLKAHPRA